MPRSQLLDPEQEVYYAHLVANVKEIAFVSVSVVLVFAAIAVSSAPSSYVLPKDNMYNASWEAELDKAFMDPKPWIIGADGVNVTFIVDIHLRDRAMKRLGMVRINFGSTWNAYCWNDTEAYNNFFPSILRTNEFRPLTQASLRFILLLTLCFKALLSYLRIASTRQNRKASLFWDYISVLAPILSAGESIAAFLTCALQQDADREYRHLFILPPLLFAFFSIFHMVLHVIVDVLIRPKKYGCNAWLRVVSCTIAMVCFPMVLNNHIPFLQRKVCTPYVSFDVALPEYLLLISLIAFTPSLVFEFPNTQLILCPMKGEIMVDNDFTTGLPGNQRRYADGYVPMYQLTRQLC